MTGSISPNLACESKIINIPGFLQRLKVGFSLYDFELQWQGKDLKIGEAWARAFVQTMGECEGERVPISLGRINFQPVALGEWAIYGVKHYKPCDYDYAPEDAFFYQFDTWCKTGKIVEIDHLVDQAKEVRHQHIVEIMAKRASLPPKKRRRVSQNWMGDFRRLVTVEMTMAEKEAM